MPRVFKATVAAAMLVLALVVPSADAQSTQTLIKRAKQALTPGGPPIEPTPILAKLAVRLPSLHGAQRRQAHALLLRPTDGNNDPQGDGYTVSEAVNSPYCTAHFCVHWVSSSPDKPDLTDSNSNGIPDWVETVANTAEHVYDVEVVQMGWRPPKDDGDGKTDIYLKQLGGQGIYGYSAPDPNQNGHDQFGYIVLDNDFKASEFPGYASPVIPLEVTLAHEFNHILQFNYDVIQDTWMLESTAVWMEGKVYQSTYDYLQYLPEWVTLTQLPLTTFSSDPNDRNNVKVYGSGVWEKWLDAHYGPDIVRHAWEVSTDTNPASFAVRAFDRSIRDTTGGTSDFAAEFDKFSAATAEWGASNSGFPDGAKYPDVQRVGGTVENGAGGTVKLDHTTFALLKASKLTGGRVKLGVAAPAGTNSAIALVGRTGGDPGGTMSEVLKLLPSGGLGSVTIDNPAQYSRLTAVLVNADFRVSGSSSLTGDWIYGRDNQSYYARLSTDFTPPHVVRISPGAGARKVSRRVHVKITFSEPVRGVTSKTVQLVAPSGHVLSATLHSSSGGKVVTLTPATTLSRNRTYKVQITREVTDTSVNQLAKSKTSTFRTAAK